MTNSEEIFVSVDVEAAGPIPGEYSLLSIGACVAYQPTQTFSCELQPINSNAVPEALAVSGHSLKGLEERGLPPANAMTAFSDWLSTLGSPRQSLVFVGLNAPFDWSFINYYFHRFLGKNPFGFSALDIKALYMGVYGSTWEETKSSKMASRLGPVLKGNHNALDDALYQAELFRLIRADR